MQTKKKILFFKISLSLSHKLKTFCYYFARMIIHGLHLYMCLAFIVCQRCLGNVARPFLSGFQAAHHSHWPQGTIKSRGSWSLMCLWNSTWYRAASVKMMQLVLQYHQYCLGSRIMSICSPCAGTKCWKRRSKILGNKEGSQCKVTKFNMELSHAASSSSSPNLPENRLSKA